MQLKVNEERYSFKYALLYTIILFGILLFPFFIYAKYLLSLQESKTEIELKKKSMQIIIDMEKYSSKGDEYYSFPRYKLYNAGLYDENHNPIFTLIDNKNFSIFQKGYHKFGDKRVYVVEFENEKYFNAKYLVIETRFDFFIVLQNVLYILISIVLIIFILSYIIFKSFIKPLSFINNALDKFIKDSMHEINTPLSIINLNIDMYKEKFGDNKYFNRIKSASKILSSIYNDMNYLIKENSIKKAKKIDINFSETLKKSIDYFQDVAELKGLRFVNNIEEDINIFFVKEKLQKIIDNNISNAIKYGKEDKDIIITLKKEEHFILFSVEDFGIGIKNPELIFSRYYREDKTKGGFGIGLNIVKQIIDDENIEATITSKIDEGSLFCYKFKVND